MKKHEKLILSLVALAIYIVFSFMPATGNLSNTSFQILGIFLATMILWMRVSITWAAPFCLTAVALTPLYTGNAVFTTAFGAWVPMFMLSSFLMCYALAKTGFLRRAAIWFITRPFASKRPWAFIAMLFLAPMIIGMFMEGVALYAIIIPITHQIFKELGYPKGHHTAQALTFGVLFTTCLSQITTPFAHTFPLMAISFYSQFFPDAPGISLVRFSVVGIASALIIYALLMLMMKFIVRPNLDQIRKINVEFLLKDHKPMSKQEKTSVAVFLCVLVIWIFPGVFGNVFPAVSAVLSALNYTIPPLFGVGLLCLIKVDGAPVLDYDDAFKNGVPWKVWMLTITAIVLGSALTNADAGIVAWIGGMIGPSVSVLSSFAAVIIFVIIVLATTNVMANAVALTLACTIALPLLAQDNSIGISAAALAVVLGMGANIAVATVPASSPAAMAIGSGWLENGKMLKWGVITVVFSALVLALVSYPVLAAIL